MLKRSLVAVFRVIPQVKRYLDEKSAMSVKLSNQAVEIKKNVVEVKVLRNKVRQQDRELRLLKGEVPESISTQLPIKERDLTSLYHPEAKEKPPRKSSGPLLLNWVVPSVGMVTGGHMDIFRTIQYLEKSGHKCRVYFYDSHNGNSLAKLKEILKKSYPSIGAELFYNHSLMKDCDALFATSWETAYPVHDFSGRARKYYYVQDYEPFFYPRSIEYLLSEKTYSFKLHGITLGTWLSKKLSDEHGMVCDHFDFGVDTDIYFNKGSKGRKEIFCYVRPISPRRGFHLALATLEKFHKKHPNYTINLVGWDVSKYKIPFPYINHGVLLPYQLNDLYNRCVAGLILSFTNMSLVPLEALASGCIPIVNSEDNTLGVEYSNWVEYAEPTPAGMAHSLEKTIKRQDIDQYSIEAAQAAKRFDWSASNSKIESILIRDLRSPRAKVHVSQSNNHKQSSSG